MQNSATKIIKFILNKKNVEKLYKNLSKQTVIPLILLSVLFIFSYYFFKPYFYNYNSNIKIIEKKIKEEFKLNIKINGKISYNFLPSPRIKIKNSEINFKKSSNIKMDKNVIFGIRADDIRLSDEDSSGTPVKGFVNLVEQLGSENLAHFNVGENNFIAKTNARAKLKLNTEYSFNFNMRHAYFFDPETGARIN